MRNKAIAALVLSATAMAAAPAGAVNWSEHVGACAAAAEAEGVVTAGAYRASFVTGSGAATKTVAVELKQDNGESVTAVCKIRRGEVTDFTVKA